MTILHATRVGIVAEIDYGEIYLAFEWPDPIYGSECLEIDGDAHCSRANSFYSGSGLETLNLSRDRLLVRFSESLAKRLMFDRDLEVRFTISDDEHHQRQQAIDCVAEVIAIRARP